MWLSVWNDNTYTVKTRWHTRHVRAPVLVVLAQLRALREPRHHSDELTGSRDSCLKRLCLQSPMAHGKRTGCKRHVLYTCSQHIKSDTRALNYPRKDFRFAGLLIVGDASPCFCLSADAGGRHAYDGLRSVSESSWCISRWFKMKPSAHHAR